MKIFFLTNMRVYNPNTNLYPAVAIKDFFIQKKKEFSTLLTGKLYCLFLADN